MTVHPSPGALAALVDGTLEPGRARRLEKHLAICPDCHEAWTEAVEIMLRERDQRETSLDLESRAAAYRVARVSAKARTMIHSDRFRAAPVVLATLVVVMGAVGVWWLGRPPRTPNEPHGPQARIAESSARGLVLPGGEPWADRPVVEYRGGAPADDEPEGLPPAAIRMLSTRGSADRIVELVSGYVAMGQLRVARTVLDAARRRHPDDSRLAVLDAVLIYRQGDGLGAENRLDDVLSREPGNALARLDLAIVLIESGRSSEAVDHLRRLERDARGQPLGRRAQQLLNRMD
jgi:anti-sigma factor RsiW